MAAVNKKNLRKRLPSDDDESVAVKQKKDKSSTSEPDNNSDSSSKPVAKVKKLKKDKEKDKGKEKAKGDKKKKDKEKDKEKDKDKKKKKEKEKEKEKVGKDEVNEQKEGKATEKKRKKDSAASSSMVIVFDGEEAFSKGKMPFGMELEGPLVVDIADKASLALNKGVRIGWQVTSVDGRAIPQGEEVSGELAAQQLREAELKMAKEKRKVKVVFSTEEPEVWKRAAKVLQQVGRSGR